MKKIIIQSEKDLENLKTLEKGEYYITLANNLSLTDFESINFNGINAIFDGDGYFIMIDTNLPTQNNVGIFNTLEDSLLVVKNLNLLGSVRGNKNVGLLSGIFNGSINNCKFMGKVFGKEKIGVVGYSNKKITFNNCDFLNLQSKDQAFAKAVALGAGNDVTFNECEYNCKDGELVSDSNKFVITKKRLLKERKC